ncbi:MAG: hypothetical protein LBK58_05005 [Prevotellaceae bacterium]|jgi:hypothetical protein|nr:hypothetical protein [Prevotellaceae bacterium]
MRVGVYTYKKRLFDGRFETRKMPVEILDEHPSTFLVRFLHVHADGRGFGTKSWVKKRSIYIAEGAKSLQAKEDYSNYLPYRD